MARDGCFCSSSLKTYPFLVVDLGKITQIHRIHAIVQENLGKHFGGIEVRVGTTYTYEANTSDVILSNLKLFGTYPGPAQPKEEVIIAPDFPLTGRYLSLQRTDALEKHNLHVCRLEIF